MLSSLSVMTLAVLITLSSAIPTLTPRSVTCSNPKWTHENASFNDIPGLEGNALNPIPTPYKGLYYPSFTMADVIILNLNPGIYPHSGNKYAASQPLSQALSGTAEFTTNYQGSNSSSFSLQSWYYGCVIGLEQGAVSVPMECTISVTGYTGSDGGADQEKVCDQTFEYEPSGLVDQMALGTFESCFEKVQFVELAYSFTGLAQVLDATIALLVDDVEYNLYYCP